MLRITAVIIAATSDTRKNRFPVIIHWGDFICTEVTVPRHAFALTEGNCLDFSGTTARAKNNLSAPRRNRPLETATLTLHLRHLTTCVQSEAGHP
jgi:hypothetical protein